MAKKASINGADKIGLDRVDELMRLVFEELRVRGGEGRPKEVLATVGQKANITPYEAESTDWFKSRGLHSPRWDTHVRFWASTCAKAGFLRTGGTWEITEEGIKALKFPKGELIREAQRIYRERKVKPTTINVLPEKEIDTAEIEQKHTIKAILDEAREDARAAIDGRLDELDAYDFQEMVAELLKAMGYYVRHVAPPGADGGVDILAFRDPLGTQTPHIKVQVKHKETKMDVKEVRQLAGILHKDTDIGLLVSSSGFTRDADREISQASKHLDRIDGVRLLELWIQHYDKITERGKQYLPLIPVYFLAPSED
ncbi:MAG: restriction endonuclease [Candidatus Sumerlaeia bacterium]|nr:restriction endonuclease [Candidatus Sumerlaeia bacterium]